MRIGINTLASVPGLTGGVGTYTRYLVEHLANIDRDNQYFLFVAPYNLEWFDVDQPNFHRVLCPIPRNFTLRVLYEQSVLPVVTKRMRLDVFHAPVNVAPLFLRIPYVLSVHDAVYRRKDAIIPWAIRSYWRVFRPRAAAGAARLIVTSETNRRDLLAFEPIAEATVRTIYNGIHERFRPLDRAECRSWAQDTYALDRPCVIWVGRPYNTKNLPRLVHGFALFNARVNHRYMLVLVGPSGWEDEALHRAIESAQIEPYVRQLGFVADEDLIKLYNASEALLFPSLQEACPFPPIEAMACGTPVITSNVSACPEIVGDAGQLVDPHDVESIAAGLHAVLTNKERWLECHTRGLMRAQDFAWSKTACHTLEQYASAANSVPACNQAHKRSA